MRLLHFVKKLINEYPILFSYPDFYSSQIRVLDQAFGVIGNGLEWAQTQNKYDGGYLCNPIYSEHNEMEDERLNDPPYDESSYNISLQLGTKTNRIFSASNSDNFFAWHPYPAFDKKFSPLWRTDFIQEDWKMGALWWLSECKRYFCSDRITTYTYYPLYNNNITSLKTFIESKIERGSSIEDIRKAYDSTIFNGDNFEELAWERWGKEIKRIKLFIEDTTNRIIEL